MYMKYNPPPIIELPYFQIHELIWPVIVILIWWEIVCTIFCYADDATFFFWHDVSRDLDSSYHPKRTQKRQKRHEYEVERE